MAEDAFQAGDLAWDYAGDGLALVRSRTPPRTELVPARMTRMLSRLSAFRTLSDHLTNLSAELRIPPAELVLAAQDLRQLADKGLLLSRSDFLDRLRGLKSPAPPPAIRWLVVLTRDRPLALERCLRSYLDNARAHAKTLQCLVVDSSTDKTNQEQNIAILRTLMAEYAVRAYFVGEGEKREFVGRLAAESGVDPDLAEFAIRDSLGWGYDTGANRNAILLATAGDPLFSADDDTICRLVGRKNAGSGVSLNAEFDPALVDLFADFEEGLKSVRSYRTEESDLFASHEALLGRPVHALLNGEKSNEINLECVQPRLIRRLLNGESQIHAVFNGLFGDCGAAYPTFYLWRNDYVRRQLIPASEERYRAMVTSRQVLRAVAKTVLGSGNMSMSTSFSMDNSQALVPYFPVGRGEDIIFGMLLNRVHPSAFCAHLPWAITHRPIDQRQNAIEDLWLSAAGATLHGWVRDAIALLKPGEDELPAAVRLRQMGVHLEALGTLAPGAFRDQIRKQQWTAAQMSIVSLKERLKKSGRTPRLWAGHLEKYIQMSCEKHLQEELTQPANGPQGLAGEPLQKLIQNLLATYGRLLPAWPALHAAAARLNRQGRGLARPLTNDV